MEIDSSQERGILQPDNAETTIEEDRMNMGDSNDDLHPETYTRPQRQDSLTSLRSQITNFFSQSNQVFLLLKTGTAITFLWALLCIILGWGTYISALAMLNNLEMMAGLAREGQSIVALKTELYVCRATFIIIMKPVINVIICMLGGDTCRFGSPNNIGYELPLSLAFLTISQIVLLRLHKQLFIKVQGGAQY